MKLTFNLAQAREINASSDRFFLQGLVRSAERYPVGLRGVCDPAGHSRRAVLPGEGEGGAAAAERGGGTAATGREAHGVREALRGDGAEARVRAGAEPQARRAEAGVRREGRQREEEVPSLLAVSLFVTNTQYEQFDVVPPVGVHSVVLQQRIRHRQRVGAVDV